MEGLRLVFSRGRVIVIMVIVVGFLATTAIVEGDQLHKVGGSKMWNQNVNYTEWSAHRRFYVGDWLCNSSFFYSFCFVCSVSVFCLYNFLSTCVFLVLIQINGHIFVLAA